MEIKLLKIGTDIEVMLEKDGKPVSAIPYFEGTRENPEIVREGMTIIHDNVNVEFTVPPTDDPLEMYKNIHYMLQYIKTRLPKGVTISKKVSAIFPESELNHPDALEFGCSAEENAYGIHPERDPLNGLRSCGGHVHVSYDCEYNKKDVNFILINRFDYFLGLPSLKEDKDKRRRKIYGNLGTYRNKPYGIEYRTLSNYWIWDLESIYKIFDRVNNVFNFEKYINEIKIYEKIKNTSHV
jgi:hypothetical protein